MKVTYLLLDGFSNLILSCLLEPLRVVEEQYGEGISWRMVTVDDEPARTSSDLYFLPNTRIGELDYSDMLVIISSNGFRQHVTPANQRLVMKLSRQSEIVIGADAGAWLLAATGLLDDMAATVHWQVMADFAEAFPQVRLSSETFVREGRIWSCGGASTGLDMILDFIGERFGADKAFTASSMFMHEANPQKSDHHPPTPLSGAGGNKLHEIMSIMTETIENPLSLNTLAERACLSPRTLNRLFKGELGMSPGQYYQSMRLARARELADGTSLDLREIALRCGYCDAAALAKAFKRVYGHSLRKPQAAIGVVSEPFLRDNVRISRQ